LLGDDHHQSKGAPVNRFLAIALAATVAGCVSHNPTDAISDAGLDPRILYVPGIWTPLDAGDQVITFSLSDYWLKLNAEADEHLRKSL
jgi:hypothetical protein